MATRYVRILHEVEAIQAKEDNLQELRSFAGDVRRVQGKDPSYPCYYTIPGLNPNGRLEIKSSQLFNQEYEPK